ncbi:hypothetical protein ABXV22_00475 [Vibrio rotiferianus]|jgi:hypothetical protein|uniref:hypothetical protein n=1 Tax=Vibrio TaxID=662 RepID=UPI0010BF463C|nr:hypothetical protein [Vibrio kanaloae]TKE90722.1 hypothetical protein FCV44_19955 [Vibrio kanaloae]TKF13633.1 hypothetical protein FCV47_18190 [Vibrio kanaloae]HCE2270948.1 hypothetical protein [Vibrio parahaemolyticus]
MSNGSNDWGVSYSRIAWLEDAIQNHDNVVNYNRHDDIIMEFDRRDGSSIVLICLDEYALGEAAVHRVLKEFPTVNYISVGGNWNGYTEEAKQLCLSKNIGLFNSSELTGALWKDEFWAYHQRDKDGNPIYPYKKERAA